MSCMSTMHRWSKVSGYQVSEYPGISIRVSGYQGIRVSGYPGIRVLGYPGIRVCIRVSGYQGIRLSGFQGIRVSGYQGIKVSGYQGKKEYGNHDTFQRSLALGFFIHSSRLEYSFVLNFSFRQS
jgi:hypothetical protein